MSEDYTLRELEHAGVIPTDERRRKLLAEEAKQPLRWWYLSFADDEAFRGACVVEGRGVLTAIEEAWARRINPGGQVLAIAVPAGNEDLFPKNRLLSLAELEEFDNLVSHGQLQDEDPGLAERSSRDVLDQDTP